MGRCGCSSSCTCAVVAGNNVTVTGTGTPADPWVINANPVAVADLGTVTADTTTIDFAPVTGAGTSGDPFIITGDVIISPDAGNTLVEHPNGLFVPAAAADVNLEALDTPCIDMTVTGTGTAVDPFVVSAVPVLDPAGGLTCGPNGLAATAADPTVFTVMDTATVDLTLTGTGTAVDPYVLSGVAAAATPTAITVTDTDCLDLTITGTGAVGDPFVITGSPIIAPEPNGVECTATGLAVIPSSDAGNTLTVGTDGRLFTPPPGAAAATVLQAQDTNCINTTVTGTGTAVDPFVVSAAPTLDPSAQNLLSCGPAGLLADVAFQVTDTPCFDFTVTGSGTTGDPFVLTGAPIIAGEPNGVECTPTGLAVIPSSDAGNTLVIGTDGRLFTPPPGAAAATVIQMLDTSCIDMTITGAGTAVDPFIISAVPVIDPSAQNVLSCGATGLLADVAAQALDTTCMTTTVTGNGTAANPFVISVDPIIAPEPNGLECTATGLAVIPSSDAGNTLVVGTDGRLFTPPPGAAAATVIQVQDTSCLNLTITGTGTAVDPFILSGVPTIDPVVGNALTCGPAGLLVDLAATALDTSCINMTVTGQGTTGDPFVISAVPIIDPAVNNQLICGPNGLFVPPSAPAVADTNSVDLTLTGSTITADVKTGCGLEVDATGVIANVATWPFPCDQDTNAEDVYCSPTTGQLQTKKVVNDVRNATADELAAGAIGGTGQRPTGNATITIDTTGFCEPVTVKMTFLSRVNFTTTAGADWRIFGELTSTTNGGAATLTTQDITSRRNDVASQIQDRKINHQIVVTLLPGFVNTFAYRVILRNDGAAGDPQITLIDSGAAINAQFTTQNP